MKNKAAIFILCFVTDIKGILSAPSNEPIVGLEAEISNLTSEVNALTKTVESLEDKMITNIADQLADKIIQNIISNNQKEASKFWFELLNYENQIRLNELLSKIVEKSYSGTRINFYPLLEFVIKNQVTTAFPLVHNELESHGHVFGGQEIFVLARYLKTTCGSNTRLFQSLSPVVRDIVSGPVMFQNVDNKGYIIASQHEPCKDKTECYGNPKNEAFLYKIFSSSSPAPEVVQNPRAHWQFVPPITMDMRNGFNATRMSWGFHIKSEADHRYLIAKMRITAFFLRDSTKFDTYYVRDMQCQYMPSLVNIEGKGHRIMIGLKEKHVYRTEYIYGTKFYKNDKKTALATRIQHDDVLHGKVWEVIPVSSSTMRSLDEVDENIIDDNGDEPRIMTEELNVSDSKCQF